MPDHHLPSQVLSQLTLPQPLMRTACLMSLDLPLSDPLSPLVTERLYQRTADLSSCREVTELLSTLDVLVTLWRTPIHPPLMRGDQSTDLVGPCHLTTEDIVEDLLLLMPTLEDPTLLTITTPAHLGLPCITQDHLSHTASGHLTMLGLLDLVIVILLLL